MPTGLNLFASQLFLDDRWIADSVFVQRRWHQPTKFPEPVLRAEHPWEQWCPVLFGTVLHFDGRFRMWYCGWTRLMPPRVCYAESDDGVVWRKPSLGLHQCSGTRETNIVLQSFGDAGLIDDITVIHDPDDRAWPLKALFWDSFRPTADAPTGIHAARSTDGIHWDRSPGLVLPGWGDRFNAVSSKVDGRYVVYGRAPRADPRGRVVWRTDSDDLAQWSAPTLVLAKDVEDPVNMQFYSATAFPYADLMLGTVERMHMAPDRLDPELVFSRDRGLTWQRARQRPAFLPLGSASAWDCAWVNLPTNAPIKFRNRLFIHYSGRTGAHRAPYPLNHGAIGLAVLRIDGFASLQAGERGGAVTTPTLTWPEAELLVNCDPRRDPDSHPGFCSGALHVEVLDASDAVVPGFSREDCVAVTENTIDAPDSRMAVAWRHERRLAALSGRTVRLRFILRDAHLYSFCAGPLPGE